MNHFSTYVLAISCFVGHYTVVQAENFSIGNSLSESSTQTTSGIISSPIDQATSNEVLRVATDAATEIAAAISKTTRTPISPSELQFETPYIYSFVEHSLGDGCIPALQAQLFNWNLDALVVPITYSQSTTSVRVSRGQNGAYQLQDLSSGLPPYDHTSLYRHDAVSRGGQGGTLDRYYFLFVHRMTVIVKLGDQDNSVAMAIAQAGFKAAGLAPFQFMPSSTFTAKICTLINGSSWGNDVP